MKKKMIGKVKERVRYRGFVYSLESKRHMPSINGRYMNASFSL